MVELDRRKETHLYYRIILFNINRYSQLQKMESNFLPCEVDLAMCIKRRVDNANTC